MSSLSRDQPCGCLWIVIFLSQTGSTFGVWHSLSMTLEPIAIRVLGTLIEKEIVTPENYPLSLNALVAGCNQRSSRDPVMDLGEEEVRQALHRLEAEGLVSVVRDARVPKYEHRARTVLNLRRDETAAVCLLLLRGPQTSGELRSRADRMYAFDDIAAVEATLQRLITEPADTTSQPVGFRPLVAALPRQSGSREVRYAHLLGGPVAQVAPPLSRLPRVHLEEEKDQGSKILLAEKVRELEGHIEALRTMIGRIEARLESQAHSTDAGNGSE